MAGADEGLLSRTARAWERAVPLLKEHLACNGGIQSTTSLKRS
jgi:hypothetical protein